MDAHREATGAAVAGDTDGGVGAGAVRRGADVGSRITGADAVVRVVDASRDIGRDYSCRGRGADLGQIDRGESCVVVEHAVDEREVSTTSDDEFVRAIVIGSMNPVVKNTDVMELCAGSLYSETQRQTISR